MNFSLETDAPSYLYAKMADHIAGRIGSGELKPNDPLPAEKILADDYGVSLGTARRATGLLRERGLVMTLRSKGTFVTGKRELDFSREQTLSEVIT
ncbi:GntR family transcriptional regulator [Amycolatopsis pigmentata]|uniref:GntR family transcriptional regulator n=1 Tax=Amycolatopsis pigmentata TaxID=450801 RepID=A0ABW5G3T3_9PSEU